MNKQFDKRYFKHLNATRFLAFLPVFFTHCFYTSDIGIKGTSIYIFVQNHLKLGLLALDYFFVLSSFLISWIVYEEYNQTNQFKAINFYVRRCLRIFPLYFLVMLLGFGLYYLTQIVFGYQMQALPSFYNFGLFILNFYMMEHGFNFLFFLTFFWSVSIEEQFYVGWALILKYLKRYAHWLAAFIIVVSIVYRATHLENNNQLVFHTFSSLGNFGVGSLLCYLMINKHKSLNFMLSISRIKKLAVYLVFAILLFFYNSIFVSDFFVVIERLVFAILFAFVIADFTYSNLPTFDLEKHKWMSYFGQLSFGLYCYHGIVLTIAIKIADHYQLTSSGLNVFLLMPIMVFSFTLMLAHYSYKYFEKPIIKFKKY